VNEKQFTEQVIDLAHLNGWRVAHFTQVQVRPGVWITPVKADGKGFPDLVLVRDRVIYAELKVGTSLRVDQVLWLERLRDAGQETYVWKPRDLDEISAVLSRR
jgi:hypothetical protein